MWHNHPIQTEDEQHFPEANTLSYPLSLLSTAGPFVGKHHGKEKFRRNPKDYKYRVMISSGIFSVHTLSLELFLDGVRGFYFQAWGGRALPYG